MTDCGGSTVTAAMSGCRLLVPEGNVEKVVTVCTDCPENRQRRLRSVNGMEGTLAQLTGLREVVRQTLKRASLVPCGTG